MIVSHDESKTEKSPEHSTSPLPLHRSRPFLGGIFGVVYAFLASAKLAIILLVAILVSCVTGVTLVRDQRAWNFIFSTYWFNGLLVLLVVNTACCFFPRIWRRRLSVVSLGMILFHLSFVGILCGAAYNSLYQFEGMLRLTEGEALPNEAPESYDFFHHGPLFKFSFLIGVTQLVKVHWGFQEDRKKKDVAYEIATIDGKNQQQWITHTTKHLGFKGLWFYPEKTGYAPLIVLSDKKGDFLYGAYVPLQTLKQREGVYINTTGTKEGPTPMDFPKGLPREKTIFFLQLLYKPSPITERGGVVTFKVWPPWKWDEKQQPMATGEAAINDSFRVNGYSLAFKELRYWVGIRVRYSPGKPFVLACLWLAFGGMVITFIGRMVKSSHS